MCSTYADAAKVFCQSAPFPEWEKRWHFKIREILGIQASYYAAFSGPIKKHKGYAPHRHSKQQSDT